MSGKVSVFGLCENGEDVIRFVGVSSGSVKADTANFRSAAKSGKGGKDGVYGWLREVGPENVVSKIVREIPFTDEPGSKADAKGVAMIEKAALIARLQGEGVVVLNGRPGLSGPSDAGLLDDEVKGDLLKCVENPRAGRMVGKWGSRESATALAVTVRKLAKTVDGARGRWYARLSQSGGGGLWCVVATFEPYKRQRYVSSKPKPKVEASWEQAAREHLRKLGIADDDISFDA